MVDFRKLGIEKFAENSGFGDEDFEIIGKIHNLDNDSLVSRIEEKDFNYLSSYSSYKIYLCETMKREGISNFLSDHKLKADDEADSYDDKDFAEMIRKMMPPCFIIQTRDREYYLKFYEERSS